MAPKMCSPKTMGEQIADRTWYCWTESPEANLGSVIAFVERTPSPSSNAAVRMVLETWMVWSSSGRGGLAYRMTPGTIGSSLVAPWIMMIPRSGLNSLKTRSMTASRSSRLLAMRAVSEVRV